MRKRERRGREKEMGVNEKKRECESERVRRYIYYNRDRRRE